MYRILCNIKAFYYCSPKWHFFFSTLSLLECIWVNVLDWSASTQKIKIRDRGPWCYKIEDVFRINIWTKRIIHLTRTVRSFWSEGPLCNLKKGQCHHSVSPRCSLSLGSSATILRETSGIPLKLELCLLFPGLFLLGGEQPLLFWRSKWQSIALKKQKQSLHSTIFTKIPED